MGIIKKVFSGIKDKKNKRVTLTKQVDIKENIAAENIQVSEETQKPFRLLEEDKADGLSDNLEQIIESTRQLDELKVEYQAVTSYLTDIQKIEMIPDTEKESIHDLARKIITLTRERDKYQNSKRKITDIQLKHIAKYEDVLPVEMKRMKSNEAYANSIKNDMKYLEGEKGALFYNQEVIEKKQVYLKGVATITCVLVIILFILFVIVNHVFQADMQLPFLMTVIMGLASAVYIYVNTVNNRKEMKITDLKLNRAIHLLNKVKIKYINNTNALDYAYQKYQVNSYAELGYLWEQYLKAKEEEKKYKNNTDQLEQYNRELVRTLRNHELADAHIWVYQAAAFIDSKEMVEVRHRLNQRRQKLRERIDYNNKLKDQSMEEVNQFLGQQPENKDKVIKTLNDYGIYID